MSLITTNQIIHGDFYDELLKIRMKTVDLILTDLPYNTTANKWDTELDLKKMWELVHHVLKDNGVFITTASQPFSSKLVMSNISEFRHEWIWIKNRGGNFANTVREPMKEHESVLVFSKGKWTYNKQMQERTGSGADRVKYDFKFSKESPNYRKWDYEGRYDLTKLRVPSSWQKFNTDTSKLHPTIKPVKLFEYLINTYSNEGDLILDCCAGSGTTAIACMNTNRNYICIEKEKKYYDVIQNRITSRKTVSRKGLA